MKCSNCDAEYSDANQTICEYCGVELVKENNPQKKRASTKLAQILSETGLKDLYQKIKKSIKD